MIFVFFFDTINRFSVVITLDKKKQQVIMKHYYLFLIKIKPFGKKNNKVTNNKQTKKNLLNY